VHNTDELKQRLVHGWHGMDQTIIDSAIDEWRGCLRACVRAKSGHFEQMLWHLLRRLSFSSVTINKRFNCDFVSISYDLHRFIYIILKKFELQSSPGSVGT